MGISPEREEYLKEIVMGYLTFDANVYWEYEDELDEDLRGIYIAVREVLKGDTIAEGS